MFLTSSNVQKDDDDNFYIFILQFRKSIGGAMRRSNPDSLKSCPCFRVSWLSFASDFLNLLLDRFQAVFQTEIILVKHLIQGRNNQAWVGVDQLNHKRCVYGRRKTIYQPELEKNFLQNFETEIRGAAARPFVVLE